MKNLGCFHIYKPADPEFPGANYICNEDGVDWYSIAWDEERIKGNAYVGVDSKGNILSVTNDGSKLFPIDMIAWEMLESEMPSGLMEDWSSVKLSNGEFSINYNAKAESQRQNLMNAANKKTADWRIELQLESISDNDKANLIEWMNYVKKLKGLDLTRLTNEAAYNSISWPPLPAN